MSSPTVSGHVIATKSADRLPKILESLRRVVDEIVVHVDPKSGDDTVDVAREYADYAQVAQEWDVLQPFHQMYERCKGDWILRVDDDETLCDAWTRERLREVLAASDATTNYFIPRKWLVPGDRYVCEMPVYPNFALRLFRNDPGIALVRETIHSQIAIAGPSGFFGDMHLLHWNYLIYSRAQREEKIGRYRQWSPNMRPGAGLAYYLYEDFNYDTAPVAAMPAPRWGDDRLERWPCCIDARVADVPVLRAGRTYFISVDVRNRSNRMLAVSPHADPHPSPELCYGVHWFGADAQTNAIVKTGVSWTPVWGPIAPGASERVLVQVAVPEVPGIYFVRPDVLQSGVGWFSQMPGAGYHGYTLVEVLADHPRPQEM